MKCKIKIKIINIVVCVCLVEAAAFVIQKSRKERVFRSKFGEKLPDFIL